MRSRKETSWKKSRKFGDIKGGRKYPKWYHAILNRFHNLERPRDWEDTPIYIQDNPSRDFYHPVTIDELKTYLTKLHDFQLEDLTHIWLKKQSHKVYNGPDAIQGCYIWGSGVHLIVLYAFPKDNKMSFGPKKPSSKVLRWYSDYCTNLIEEKDNWYLQWEIEEVRQYFLNGLLLHEIGHHIDQVYKHSKASQTKAENWADGFAFYWANKLREKI